MLEGHGAGVGVETAAEAVAAVAAGTADGKVVTDCAVGDGEQGHAPAQGLVGDTAAVRSSTVAARAAGSPESDVVLEPAIADDKSCEVRQALIQDATAEGIARNTVCAAGAADSPIFAQGAMCN